MLGVLVGDLQDGGAGLDEDLGPREGGAFLGEVGVADGAFGFGQVADGVLEGGDVGVQGGVLEGAEASAEAGDAGDGLVDHVGGMVGSVLRSLALPDLSS